MSNIVILMLSLVGVLLGRGIVEVELWTLNRENMGSNPLAAVSKLSRSNFSVVEFFPGKSRWRWNEQVCQGVKCNAL